MIVLFVFPKPPPTSNYQCIAKCKECNCDCKYSLNTKANLHHHLSNLHSETLKLYFQRNTIESKQQPLDFSGGTLELKLYH